MEGFQEGLTEQNRFIKDGRFVATMGGTRKKKINKKTKTHKSHVDRFVAPKPPILAPQNNQKKHKKH